MGRSARVPTGAQCCAGGQTGKGSPMLSAEKRRGKWPEWVPVESWAETRRRWAIRGLSEPWEPLQELCLLGEDRGSVGALKVCGLAAVGRWRRGVFPCFRCGRKVSGEECSSGLASFPHLQLWYASFKKKKQLCNFLETITNLKKYLKVQHKEWFPEPSDFKLLT